MKKIKTLFRKGFWRVVRDAVFSWLKSPAFYIYLFAVLIYLPWFLPYLSDIKPWDETYYVLRGKELIQGQIPALSQAPVVAAFYALIYLPFRNSPFWLVQTNSIGRFLLFSGLFLGVWQVGKSMKNYYQPLILFGFLFLSPVLTSHFEYPADPLFITFSAIAFSQVINYLETKQIKQLGWSSFWLGVAMLTRGDALIISLPFFIVTIAAGWRSHKWWRLALAAIVPFLAVTAGYVLARGVITGDFNTHMAEYSYAVFEQGQEADLPGGEQRFANPTESYYVARERFGTPEENNYSMFTAILRNPDAYLARVKSVITWIPGLYLNAYFRRYTPLITLLALRGLVELIHKKKYSLAAVHLIWILPIGTGVIRTLYRVGYFRMFVFVIFSLAALGLKTLLNDLKRSRWWVLAWSLLFATVMVLAYFTGESGIQFAMMVCLGWIILAFLLSRQARQFPNWQSMAMLLLLAVGFMLKTDYLIYEPRQLGDDYREQASLTLRDVTEPGSYVLTGTPSVVLMANREVANFSSRDIPEFSSSEDFIDWMRVQDFIAIYLDREAPQILWDLVSEQQDVSLTLIWSDEENDAYIYLLDQ